MPRFAANLTMLYPEHAFLDRFAAAAADGFEGVECLFPYEAPAHEIRQRLQAHGLQQVLFNAPPGDWSRGERGLAALPGREAEFRAGFAQALAYADTLACPRIHVMAGCPDAATPLVQALDTYRANLAWAAGQARAEGRFLTIEPLNPRDMPGYLLTHQAQAHAIVAEVGADNLQVQMDLYHCQIVEGDLEMRLRQYLTGGRVGHLQIAGVPQRHEPDTGEVNYAHLFTVIDELAESSGWSGWVGAEYRPRRGAAPGGTSAGLGWRPPACRGEV